MLYTGKNFFLVIYLRKIKLTVYHIHHIVPKHMGGLDNSDNLIKLSVEEHALTHKILFEKYGHEEDRLAWLGLMGYLNEAEIHIEKSKLGGYKSKGRIKSEIECLKLKNSWTDERKKQNGEMASLRFKDKPKSPEHVSKMKLVVKSKEEIHRMKQTQIQKNLSGKKVVTPEGVFQSINDCSRKMNVPKRTVCYRAKNKIMGYSFLDNEGVNFGI